MADARPGGPLAKGPRGARRSGVLTTSAALVDVAPLRPDRALPILVRPVVAGVDLTAWLAEHRAVVEQHLTGAGAVLLRGFRVPDAGTFEALVATLYPNLVAEHERSSPRHRVAGNVYTSTDHPADQTIF